MKLSLTAALVLSLPIPALAQTAAPASAVPKAAAPTMADGSGSKEAAQQKKAPIRRSAAKVVEERTPIDTDPSITLSDDDLEMAKRVYLGTIPCEFGASVTITPNDKRAGFFTVVTKGSRFSMHPVGSRTGAIRLEDPRAGAMWLQLGNKSMLMSQKIGQRLADECMSPAQVTYADELKKNPIPGILDAPKPVVK